MTFANLYKCRFGLSFAGIVASPFEGREADLFAFGKSQKGAIAAGLRQDGHCDKIQIFESSHLRGATHAAAITPTDPKLAYLLQGESDTWAQPVICAQRRAGRVEWAIGLGIEGATGPSILAKPASKMPGELAMGLVTPSSIDSERGLTVTLVNGDGTETVAFFLNLERELIPRSAFFADKGTLVVVAQTQRNGDTSSLLIMADLRRATVEAVELNDPKGKWSLLAEHAHSDANGRIEISGFASNSENKKAIFRFTGANAGTAQLLPLKGKAAAGELAADAYGTYACGQTTKAPFYRLSRDADQSGLMSAFALETTAHWSGLAVYDNSVFLCGSAYQADAAALVALDQSLACCCLEEPKPVDSAKLKLSSRAFKASLRKIKVGLRKEQIEVSSARVEVGSLCADPSDPPNQTNWPPEQDKPDGDFRMDDDTLIQSAFIQIETVGSDGTHAARGILARWELMGALGQHHFPKGDFSSGPPRMTDGGLPIFNRPDDYVRLYRFAMPSGLQPEMLDLITMQPALIDDSNARWSYTWAGGTVHLRFADPTAYAQTRSVADPHIARAQFLESIDSPIEVRFSDHCCYRIGVKIEPKGSAQAQATVLYAALSKQDLPSDNEADVVARGQFSVTGGKQTITAPNMTSLWLHAPQGILLGLELHSYRKALSAAVRQSLITPLGRYALTLDEATVAQRLETAEPTQVHDHWPRFSGTAVNAQSYNDKWNNPNNNPDTGLSQAVDQYRNLSETDPLAMADFHDDPLPGMASANTRMSYLDILRLASSDFHSARQLGLGTVDAAIAGQNQEYFHFVEYRVDLDLGIPDQRRTHISISLPTRPSDARMARPPSQHQIGYGLPVSTADPGGYNLTDEDGYTPDGEARFIRHSITHELYHENAQTNPLVGPHFSLSQEVIPSFFRLDYRKQGESNWRNPGIGADRDHTDSGGTAEQLPSALLEDPSKPAVVQMETEPGVAEYRAYSIDLFSRASAPTNITTTDFTDLRQPNGLLPPSNLRVQLIQEEDVRALLLSTATEQMVLDNHPNPQDKTLVRIQFDYNHIQETNYALPQSWRDRDPAPDDVFADNIDLLFRPRLPLSCEGEISQVDDLGSGRLRLHSGSTTLESTQEQVTPRIAAADVANFVGAALTYDQQTYIIETIAFPSSAPNDPLFTVYPSDDSVSVSDAGGQAALSTQNFLPAPSPGRPFLTVENLGEPDNWGTNAQLNSAVQIAHPDWQVRTEQQTDPLGNERTLTYRGFWEEGSLTPDPTVPHEYKLEFSSFTRPPHPQDTPLFPGSDLGTVQFTRGTVRVPLSDGSSRRDLQVFAEDWDNQTLYLRDVEAISASDGNTSEPLATGGNLEFNYYPSYLVYLLADPAVGLTADTILPARGEGLKQTLIGARSRDVHTLDRSNVEYTSAIGVPAKLLAQEIRVPGTPNAPTSLAYATPPDAQDKSSLRLGLTFEDRPDDPFAVIFLRTDLQSVLSAMYAVETRKTVESKIFPIRADASFKDRLAEVFAVRDDGPFTFSDLPLSDQESFALPLPDSPEFLDDPETALTPGKVLQKMIRQRFLPLSEQPLLFDHIPEWSSGHRPRRGPQKVRGEDGSLLPPTDPSFEIAPMAVRFSRPSDSELTDPGTSKAVLQSMLDDLGVSHALSETKAQLIGKVRGFYDTMPHMQFVDYTLSGSKHPDTVYFYAAQELGNRMQFGQMSGVHGPVYMVNTRPAEPPIVKSVLAEQSAFQSPRVKIEAAYPEEYEDIAAYRLYRSTSGIAAQSVRTMGKVSDWMLTELDVQSDDKAARSVTLYDRFDDGDVPFGEPLFYRLVALRHAAYQDDNGDEQIAVIPSQPSRVCLTNVADSNPPLVGAPTITAQSDGPDHVLVTLEWDRAAHNCVYYPSILSENGIWQRLGELAGNDAVLSYPPQGNGNPVIRLPRTDPYGETIEYRFKIDSVNASGLTNTTDNETTVSFD